MKKILKTYLRRLTNLSANNRSLLLLRLISDQFIDIHDFDYLLNDPSFEIIKQLIGQKNKIDLTPQIDSRDKQSNEISIKLKKLQRIERFIYEERGAKDLYVGWPFVRGKFADGSLVRCPLLFFPVDILLEGGMWKLVNRKGVNVTFNKTFLLAYSYYNQIEVDEELVERVFDDLDKDSTVFRTSLYQLIRQSPVEVNFNQENFIDKLIGFKNFRKAEFDDSEKNGVIKLFPEAVLGIFPQAGSHLMPDYLTLLENESDNDIEDFFKRREVEDLKDINSQFDRYRFLQKVKEEQMFTPFKIDAFQENALKAVKSGNSIVVQGPPGTGKSQLICNLISDFISRGKNVLIVSQKRAALDVVYQRLREKKMDDFCALVHDFKNDRKDIYQNIDRQIDSLDEYKMLNSSIDAIQIERKFLQGGRRIDQLVEELEEFKFSLFDEKEAGISIKELYLTSNPDAPSINIKQEYKYFKLEDVDDFSRRLRFYTAYAVQFSKPDYPWRDRESFSQYQLSDLKHLKKIISEIPAYQQEVQEKVKSLINAELPLEVCEAIMDNQENINKFLDEVKEPKAYKYFQHMISFKDADTDQLWLSNIERVMMDCYKGEGPELSLKTQELGRFQEILRRALRVRKNLFSWIKWKLFSKDKLFISRVLVANGLKNNRKGFRTLVEKFDSRLNLEHNISKLKESPWVTDLPKKHDKIAYQNWFYCQKKALNAKLFFTSLRNFKRYFNVQMYDYESLRKKFREFLSIIEDTPVKRATWQKYLTSNQINTILAKPTHAERLIEVLEKDFDSLCEQDKLWEEFKPHEMEVIQKLFERVETLSEENISDLFQNSLRLAWIEHIETKFPVLRAVSSLKFQKMVQELQEMVNQKHAMSSEITLLKARERTYQDVEYNRLNNLVTYRDLGHQVRKKRRVWPIRKLIANYFDEIFDLIPCWMASPESISAIFSMKELFDLVVFDEASQCFVEKGIPAMYRGKQIVIAGDDKQLKPNELYKVRWDEDSDDIPELEIDSLLNLADKYLMQVHLNGHYRSKSLDLIDFSNRYFYNGGLKMLPDFKDINLGEPAIKYIKVDGIWENNTNVIEAEKVVSLVRDLNKESPDKEMGIVTFNAKQQELIYDLLESNIADADWSIPNNIFIKNIENVQGDEKDIIIFSTAYAPDPQGKLTIQFGSLNLPGGENRLNVAVTRAREAVYVVSSIYPEQLQVENSRNDGPKLLKKYLQYAQDVSRGENRPSAEGGESHSKSWYLKNKIVHFPEFEKDDYKCISDLPFADLVVKKDGRYKGVILTDDNIYHQSISVKEAHVYTPFTLHKKNWRFSFFSSRQYWMDKQSMRERVAKFLNSTG